MSKKTFYFSKTFSKKSCPHTPTQSIRTEYNFIFGFWHPYPSKSMIFVSKSMIFHGNPRICVPRARPWAE